MSHPVDCDPFLYRQSVRVVEAVLRELRDRSGFDWWWDDIDPEIQEEIRDELVSTVFKALELRASDA